VCVCLDYKSVVCVSVRVHYIYIYTDTQVHIHVLLAHRYILTHAYTVQNYTEHNYIYILATDSSFYTHTTVHIQTWMLLTHGAMMQVRSRASPSLCTSRRRRYSLSPPPFLPPSLPPPSLPLTSPPSLWMRGFVGVIHANIYIYIYI
jgi:hypothetical protein